MTEEDLVRGLAVVFQVPDAIAAAEYYRDKLGFKINYTWGDPPEYVSVSRGGALIHFANGDTVSNNPQVSDAYLFVSHIDALYQDFLGHGARILQELQTWPYGMREFVVEDLNGYRLCFGEGVESP